jgi:cysteinyl-tRNA synthetase
MSANGPAAASAGVASTAAAAAAATSAAAADATGRPYLANEHAYARAADDHTGDCFAEERAVHALLAARQRAREARAFKRADALRAELAAFGVEVRASCGVATPRPGHHNSTQ